MFFPTTTGALVARLQASLDGYRTAVREVVALSRGGDKAGALAVVRGVSRSNDFATLDLIGKLVTLNEEGAARAAHSADQTYARARSLVGRPYLWGANSPKGLDCSGFTKLVFYCCGIDLARNASEQVHQGREVPLGPVEVRAGSRLQRNEGDEVRFRCSGVRVFRRDRVREVPP